MTTIPDLSTLSVSELISLKAAIDVRLDELRERHVEEGAALGLTLVDGNAAPKRKRRTTSKQDHDA